MKAYFDKQTLLAAIAPAASIAQTKNTMAAVDGILLECPPNQKFGEFEGDGQNQCRISAFDLEKGLRTTIPCRTEEEGMYVINTVKMLQIVRALPEGEIAVEINERGRVSLSSGFSKFEITASPGEDFPSMPRFVGDSRCLISQRLLRTMIGETVFPSRRTIRGLRSTAPCSGSATADSRWSDATATAFPRRGARSLWPKRVRNRK